MKKKLFEEINFLEDMPIFKGWSFRSLKDLFYHTPIVTYKRGCVIYDQGEHPVKMYIIKKGKFRVTKKNDLSILIFTDNEDN